MDMRTGSWESWRWPGEGEAARARVEEVGSVRLATGVGGHARARARPLGGLRMRVPLVRETWRQRRPEHLAVCVSREQNGAA